MVSNLAKLCGCNLDGTMKADAVGIFKDARDFEIQLRMLKAVYTFRMCKILPNGEKLKHGFDFSDECMDDRSLQRSAKSPRQALSVDFIMRPGLYKRGNNSGANYETQICLIKMGVICNAKKLCLNSGSSTSSRSTITSGSSTNSHDATQMQSSTIASTKTRSQASPKTDTNVRSGKSNTKPTSNHHSSTRTTRGRGGGTPGKKTRAGKGPDPDGDFNPANRDGI